MRGPLQALLQVAHGPLEVSGPDEPQRPLDVDPLVQLPARSTHFRRKDPHPVQDVGALVQTAGKEKRSGKGQVQIEIAAEACDGLACDRFGVGPPPLVLKVLDEMKPSLPMRRYPASWRVVDRPPGRRPSVFRSKCAARDVERAVVGRLYQPSSSKWAASSVRSTAQ